jgi:crotonobetainyl-CoA:carnitine CoA-transferase CaiB-like acyl-CoA transferase
MKTIDPVQGPFSLKPACLICLPSSALQRFRVIDLTQVRAGPTACRQLADWGAT